MQWWSSTGPLWGHSAHWGRGGHGQGGGITYAGGPLLLTVHARLPHRGAIPIHPFEEVVHDGFGIEVLGGDLRVHPSLRL